MSKIHLPIHKIKLKDLISSSPDGNIDKLFLQCQLTSIKEGEALFSVIAYVGSKSAKQWSIGKRVECTESHKRSFDLTQPIGFANTEVNLNLGKKKYKLDTNSKNLKAAPPKKSKASEFLSAIQADEKLMLDTELTFTPKISDNPHISFDVAIGIGERQFELESNPSPPAPPLDEEIL